MTFFFLLALLSKFRMNVSLVFANLALQLFLFGQWVIIIYMIYHQIEPVQKLLLLSRAYSRK